jgi:predicted nucleic acid-binding protein
LTRLVVDASALAAVAFQEAEGPAIRDRLDGAQLFAPTLLRFELINTALKKVRRHPAEAARILTAVSVTLERRWDIDWREVAPADVILIAHALGLSAYDASYVWLAGSLGADLVTLDARIAEASARLSM